MEAKPPPPPFTLETALAKVQIAEKAWWNTCEPERCALPCKALRKSGKSFVDSEFKSLSIAKASNTAEASYPRSTHPRLARCLKSMNLSNSELLERIGRGMLQVLSVQQLVEEQPED